MLPLLHCSHGIELILSSYDLSPLLSRRVCFFNGRPSCYLCLSTMFSHFNRPSSLVQESPWVTSDPYIPLSTVEDTSNLCRAPPPSPILRPQKAVAYGGSDSSPSYAMPTVDEQLTNHTKKLAQSPRSGYETWMRKKSISVDSSPLHQVSSAEDDYATPTSLEYPSPTFGDDDDDTLRGERASQTRAVPATLTFKGVDSGDQWSWPQPIPEISPPTSPTFSESSLDSTTSLCPNKIPAPLHPSETWQPRPSARRFHVLSPSSTSPNIRVGALPPTHNRRISLPFDSNSSIDAKIRPSSISSISKSIKPTVPVTKSTLVPAQASETTKRTQGTKSKSRPKCTLESKVEEVEKIETVNVDPMSQFSDDEDDHVCKRVGRMFSWCLGSRKA